MSIKLQQLSTPALLGILLMLLSGCAGVIADIESPKVSLADIQIREIRALEASFLVKLRVTNPNDRSLEITGLACELELENKQFASGLQGQGRTIAPYSSELVEVHLYASMLEMFSSLLELLQYGGQGGEVDEKISYGLSGHVNISSGKLSRKLPFQSSGELNLAQIQATR